MRNHQQNKFAAITLSAALALLAVATLPSTTTVQAQEVQYCFNEENGNGVVIGFSCFNTREECHDFQKVIKQTNVPEETGIEKVTNCRVVEA